MKMRAGNVRSSFSATSIIFGSVIGFLIAGGLANRTLSLDETALLSVWLFTFAGVAHNLLKTAENIVWHVPWTMNALGLFLVALPAAGIGFYQEIIPIDDKLWTALILAWVIATLGVAVIERPTISELTEE